MQQKRFWSLLLLVALVIVIAAVGLNGKAAAQEACAQGGR